MKIAYLYAFILFVATSSLGLLSARAQDTYLWSAEGSFGEVATEWNALPKGGIQPDSDVGLTFRVEDPESAESLRALLEGPCLVCIIVDPKPIVACPPPPPPKSTESPDTLMQFTVPAAGVAPLLRRFERATMKSGGDQRAAFSLSAQLMAAPSPEWEVEPLPVPCK